eukprot:snap_masked-scaffold_2-processed-gene-23.49-mRNA-1 protein AED:1.00 eAED:1.00 QI:0/0/0/0/1/1/3/0/426
MPEIQDLLGISSTDLAAAKQEANELKNEEKQKSEAQKKKYSKLSNEVYKLLDAKSLENLPSIIPTSTSNGITKSLVKKMSAKKAVSWKHSEFQNPGRVDGLKLRHWNLAASKEETYNFSKYNRKVPVPRVEDSISSLCEGTDWTLLETEFLFYLCEKYDLRWFVIDDRWNDDSLTEWKSFLFSKNKPTSSPISEQDSFSLKSWFLKVCKSLGKNENNKMNVEEKDLFSRLSETKIQSEKSKKLFAHVLKKIQEKPEKLVLERLRRKYLDGYYNKEDTERKEEEKALDEISKLEKEIEDLKKKIRKKEDADVSNSGDFLRKNKALIGLYLENINSENSDILASDPGLFKRREVSGVALRSARVFMFPTKVSVGKRIVEKILRALDELDVPRRPRFVSTEETIEAYDKLRQDILKLLLIRKYLKKNKI